MANNIQMYYLNSSGYQLLYPQTNISSIVDFTTSINNFLSNYYTKTQTLTSGTASLYGTGISTPDQVFQQISTLLDGKLRYQILSYNGTGTYGSNNPMSLTFNFSPIWVQYVASVNAYSTNTHFGWGNDSNAIYGNCVKVWPISTTSYTRYLGFGGYYQSSPQNFYGRKLNDYTIQWYFSDISASADSQMNSSGTTYYVLAIG